MSSVRHANRAFSLTEVLVVITILAIVIGLAVPAFSSLLTSTERSLADNQLRVGLSAGRDAAIRSEGGDGAAVFVFSEGRLSIIPCVQVGRIFDRFQDLDQNPPLPEGEGWRDVFAPIVTAEPVTLPRGWSVRAYAPPESISNASDNRSGWYEWMKQLSAEGGWVFPESSFINLNDGALGNKGYYRQTFMVRFKSATGSFDAADATPALVLLPLSVGSGSYRAQPPWSDPSNRIDLAFDLAGWARRVLKRPATSTAQLTNLRKLLGDVSPDTVLARPVTELALYYEPRMIRDIRGRQNRVTGTMYADPNPPPPATPPNGPTFDPASLPASMDSLAAARAISAWIEGRFIPQGSSTPVASDAVILSVQRYLGQVQEVRP